MKRGTGSVLRLCCLPDLSNLGRFGCTMSKAVASALAEAGLRDERGADQEAFDFLESCERQIAEADGRQWSGKGRKPGAKNIATRQAVDFVRQSGVEPLVAWGRGARMPFEDFAAMMGVEPEQLPGMTPSERYAIRKDWLAFRERNEERIAGIFYPKSVLEQLFGEQGENLLAVVGLAAMAQARPGQVGAAKPSLALDQDGDQREFEKVHVDQEVSFDD